MPVKPSRAGVAPAGARMPQKAQPRLSPLEPLEAQSESPIDDSLYSGDPEADSAMELDSVKSGFRDRMKAEADRFKSATSTDYYFVVVCNSGEQAGALMRGLGVNPDVRFADGREIARRFNIDLPADPPPVERIRSKADPKLSALVRMPKAKGK